MAKKKKETKDKKEDVNVGKSCRDIRWEARQKAKKESNK